MDAILKHVLDVTGHRDHQLLDVSILSALQQMAGVVDGRILNLTSSYGRIVLHPGAWISSGKVEVISDFADREQIEEALSAYPVLQSCIDRNEQYAMEVLPGGVCRAWFLIWVDGKVSTCFEIRRRTKLTRKQRDLIEGMLGVYRNFVSLLDYSERDSLTGLFNRKTFEKHFSRSNTRSEGAETLHGSDNRRHDIEYKQQWLAVIDIDHFKRVNDAFGHLYGDEVLMLVSQLMKSSFRAQDRIFRFGGEEFVIILHAATRNNVAAVIERFRLMIEQYRFPQVGQVTVSVGFTGFSPDDSPVEVLGHADNALYYAKEHGRNRVCQYEDLVEQGVLRNPATVEVAAIEYF